jgi:hypothetical protein
MRPPATSVSASAFVARAAVVVAAETAIMTAVGMAQNFRADQK